MFPGSEKRMDWIVIMHAKWEIMEWESNDECLTIRDTNEPLHLSVTNDVEYVVEILVSQGLLPPSRRLEYYDTQLRLDQILVKNGKFTGFAPRQPEE
jgi:hypothetical protein